MPARERPLVAAARRAGVRDRRVLDAIAAVPRDVFVRAVDEAAAEHDRALRIGSAQTTTQPSLVGRMVEALELQGHERVLEVGTGLGYQAAVLGHLAAEVSSIERFEELAEVARRNLAAAGLEHVRVGVGDGTRGWPDHAPYDAIIVAAAFTDVPAALGEQFRPGGRLVQPIGPGGREEVTVFEATERGLQPVRALVAARFVRLVGTAGFER